MTWSKKYSTAFIAIWLIAIVLRIHQLDQRPFHVDEAVNGLITGNLLEKGYYVYDPSAYHGPVLYYLTLPIIKLAGVRTASELTEWMLRLLPALAGSSLILLLLPLRNFARPAAILFSAFLLSLSSMLVYYSRYFIHEMLLVFFTVVLFVYGFIYLKTGRTSAVIWAGLSAGLMISTKETWIIIIFTMLVVFITEYLRQKKNSEFKPVHLLYFVIALTMPVIVFYSSFFSNPGGLSNIFEFLGHYIERAGGEQIHRYPFEYYLKVLFFYDGEQGVFFAEAGILVLAILGIWQNGPHKFPGLAGTSGLAFLILFLIFSIIPYKTPWNIACSLPLLIISTSLLILDREIKIIAWPIRVMTVIGCLLLCYQMLIINFRLAEAPGNPYTYAQSGNDVLQISAKFDAVHNQLMQPDSMDVMIIAPDHAYWPLPWYLRKWPKISWWSRIPDNFYQADLLIITESLEPELSRKLYEQIPVEKRQMFVYLFNRPMELYPGNTVLGLVNLDIWEKLRPVNEQQSR